MYQEPYLSLSSLITGATKWRLKSLVQFFPYMNFCAQTLFWNKLCSAQRSWNVVSSKLLSFQHAAEKPQSCSQLQAMVSITGPGISACHAPSQRCLMTAAGILIIQHMWCITPSTGTLIPTRCSRSAHTVLTMGLFAIEDSKNQPSELEVALRTTRKLLPLKFQHVFLSTWKEVFKQQTLCSGEAFVSISVKVVPSNLPK